MPHYRVFLDVTDPTRDLRIPNPECPNAAAHTPCPVGYNDWDEWARIKSKTHRQITCQHCGRYVIWLPKAEARRVLDERRRLAIENDARCRARLAAEGL
jgi:hypothetical protein